MRISGAQLQMTHISKIFGPVKALDDVTFTVKRGTVHALCGENGAGKSTLMKILAGVYQPDTGEIFIDDQKCSFSSPDAAITSGISMLYQELNLTEDMTVYENIFLGNEPRCRVPFVIDRRRMIAKTEEYCRRYGFNIDPVSRIESLTPGQCQIVELIKALVRDVRIVVMDEPTSSLSESEAKQLINIVNDLRDRGLTIIYISHRMKEIMELADEITVLRDGRTVKSGMRADMNIPEIVRLMVGREIKDFYPSRQSQNGNVCFEAHELSTAEGISDVSFSVKAGEIVGMAGLVGAGRSEVAKAIFGVEPLLSGYMTLEGKKMNIKQPRDAISEGIAMLTEDRKRTGICMNLPCGWNMTLPNYKRIGMKYILKLHKEREICDDYAGKISVKWFSQFARADSLSGGNQQKLLIGRWLMAESKFLIFDEPTRGIDVGAKKEVYTILNELTAKGKAILIISSELPEIFGICDVILVMRRGRLVGSFRSKDTDPEKVMHLAAVEE